MPIQLADGGICHEALRRRTWIAGLGGEDIADTHYWTDLDAERQALLARAVLMRLIV